MKNRNGNYEKVRRRKRAFKALKCERSGQHKLARVTAQLTADAVT
jgi:hypothetical protein